jgi:hypothetical protein
MAVLHCMAKELASPDDARIRAYFEIIDAMFNTRIEFVSQGHRWRRVEDRLQQVAEWIPTTTGNKAVDVFGNGAFGRRQVIASVMNVRHGAGREAPRASEYRVVIADRSGFVDVLPVALARIAEGVHAWYGSADTDVGKRQVWQTPADLAEYPEYGRIAGYKTYSLQRRKVFGVDALDQPVEMGLAWLNYWSDRVARVLRFPDPERDRPITGCYERVADRGWLVRLTPEPLDLERPEHLERMQWAYDRFGSA